jgi:putative tricarboxylic transport membrane protein
MVQGQTVDLEAEVEEAEGVHTGASMRDLVTAVVLMAGYVIAFTLLGFLISTVLFLFVWMRWVARAGWLASLFIMAGTTAGFYAIFAVLLDIPFPTGLLGI